MTQLTERFTRFALSPPLWMRIFAVPLFALMAYTLASKRGWLVGVVAAVVYGLIMLPMAVSPSSVVSWSRRHPVIDGSIVGPLLFLALAYLTSWPLWVCALIGVAGISLGALRGAQRGRHMAARQQQGIKAPPQVE